MLALTLIILCTAILSFANAYGCPQGWKFLDNGCYIYREAFMGESVDALYDWCEQKGGTKGSGTVIAWNGKNDPKWQDWRRVDLYRRLSGVDVMQRRGHGMVVSCRRELSATSPTASSSPTMQRRPPPVKSRKKPPPMRVVPETCAPIPADRIVVAGPDVLFKEIDKNGDTFLDMDELRYWFIEFVHKKKLELWPYDKFIGVLDSDHNGELDSAEATCLFNSAAYNIPEARSIYRANDVNNDGKLNKQELRRMVKQYIRQILVTSVQEAIEKPKTYEMKLRSKGISPTWYDMNRDGQMGEMELNLAQIVLRVLEMFGELTRGGDHMISAEEFADSQAQSKFYDLILVNDAQEQVRAQHDANEIPSTLC